MVNSNRLREARLEKGISQGEIAKAVGISRSAYAKYECGNRQPMFETFIKICDFLDVSSDYILGRENI